MKRLTKWLVPPFLRRFDRYLLENYPSVWSTGGHFVLFYGILAAIGLFVAGFCYPVSFTNLTVAPIEAIDITEENYFRFSLLLVLVSLGIWINYFLFKKIKNIQLTLTSCGISIFLLVGIIPTSYRMGIIHRTASDSIFALANKAEIEYLEHSRYFSHGIILTDSIHIYNDSINKEFYFNKKRQYFDMVLLEEDTLLTKRYDSNHLNQLLKRGLIQYSKVKKINTCSYRSHYQSVFSGKNFNQISFSYREYLLRLAMNNLISKSCIPSSLFVEVNKSYFFYRDPSSYNVTSLKSLETSFLESSNSTFDSLYNPINLIESKSNILIELEHILLDLDTTKIYNLPTTLMPLYDRIKQKVPTRKDTIKCLFNVKKRIPKLYEYYTIVEQFCFEDQMDFEQIRKLDFLEEKTSYFELKLDSLINYRCDKQGFKQLIEMSDFLNVGKAHLRDITEAHKRRIEKQKFLLVFKDIFLYHDYYSRLSKSDSILISNTGVPITTDTINYLYNYDGLYIFSDTIMIKIPFIQYPHILEDGVRSIEHARQYLQEGIVFRYYKSLLLHLLLLVFLLYAVPYSNFASILGSVLGYLVLVAGGLYFLGKDHDFIDYFYLLPTSVALLPLLAAWWQGEQTAWSRFAVQWFTVGVLFTLLFAFSETDDLFPPPSEFSFYGVQVLCLLVLLVHHRVRALPKAA